MEDVVDLAERLQVDVSERVSQILRQVLPAAAEESIEAQIDDLYDELAGLARSGSEERYQNRLARLRRLEEQEAARYSAAFDRWRPLPRGELERVRDEARKLIGK